MNSSSVLRIKLLSSTATCPRRQSGGAAGYDLHSAVATVIESGTCSLVPIGIALVLPENTYGRIACRSSLAVKGLSVEGGVIDSDYRGELKVLLRNHASSDFEIGVGDRIAQLIVEKIATPDVIVVDELEESARGSGGFGSTGQ